MRPRTAFAVILAVLAAILVAPDPAAAAARRVMIFKIYYDSPGADTGSNSSINAERIVLKNPSSRRIDLQGWTVRDAHRHVYRFSDTYHLWPGRTVVLHSGRGTDSGRHLYWGRTRYVWNNTTDTAKLRSPAGRLRDSCSYRGPNDQSPAGAMITC
jgi:hypothetical protein